MQLVANEGLGGILQLVLVRESAPVRGGLGRAAQGLVQRGGEGNALGLGGVAVQGAL